MIDRESHILQFSVAGRHVKVSQKRLVVAPGDQVSGSGEFEFVLRFDERSPFDGHRRVLRTPFVLAVAPFKGGNKWKDGIKMKRKRSFRYTVELAGGCKVDPQIIVECDC